MTVRPPRLPAERADGCLMPPGAHAVERHGAPRFADVYVGVNKVQLWAEEEEDEEDDE